MTIAEAHDRLVATFEGCYIFDSRGTVLIEAQRNGEMLLAADIWLISLCEIYSDASDP